MWWSGGLKCSVMHQSMNVPVGSIKCVNYTTHPPTPVNPCHVDSRLIKYNVYIDSINTMYTLTLSIDITTRETVVRLSATLIDRYNRVVSKVRRYWLCEARY